MPDIFNMTNEMNDYFKSLPKSVQSALVYSGANANSLADLKAVAQEYLGNEAAEEK